jgi:hypothetical protein
MSGSEQGQEHETTVTDGHGGHHADAHDDERGHEEETLGPIDWQAWGAALLGAASGALVAIVLYAGATQG